MLDTYLVQATNKKINQRFKLQIPPDTTCFSFETLTPPAAQEVQPLQSKAAQLPHGSSHKEIQTFSALQHVDFTLPGGLSSVFLSAARGQFPVKAQDNLSKGKAPGFCIRRFFNEFLLQWLKKCSSSKRFKNANKLITNGSPAVRFTEFRKGPFGFKKAEWAQQLAC